MVAGVLCGLFGIFWMKRAFEYQDDLIEANNRIYELNQSIEMYQIYTGELR
jgi:hypothetical protein